MSAPIGRRKFFQTRGPQWHRRESNIFVSYRRDDSAGYAGRLYDRLSRHFGKDQVFMDVDHIEPGEDFLQLINDKIRACGTLIVLIGRNWVGAADKTGTRRLDNPEDFVRLEITAACAANVRVMLQWQWNEFGKEGVCVCTWRTRTKRLRLE